MSRLRSNSDFRSGTLRGLTIVIAGGSGFLGRKLAKVLEGEGHAVRILTRRPARTNDVPWNPDGSSGTLRAANGLVATGHHLATAAGLAALRDGGTAADAAIAAAAVCAVVLPQSTSIGGDVFALHYDARTGEVTAYIKARSFLFERPMF